MGPTDWHVPLGFAAAAFAAYMIWRSRPHLGPDPDASGRATLAEAQRRIEGATTGGERALALCDAGDACVSSLRRRSSALGFYLRAMREDPSSAVIVDRAVAAFARRPRTLETLLWRRLALEPWAGPNRVATAKVVSALAKLYAGPLRSGMRARALENAVALFGS